MTVAPRQNRISSSSKPSISSNPQDSGRTLSLTHTLHMENGASFRVCAATFQTITGVTRRRINLLCHRFQSSGGMPRERRGGSRIKQADIEVQDSIINWIKRYKCRESHYGRSKSTRKYLPPELNIVKIFKAWKEM